jgi:TolB protein
LAALGSAATLSGATFPGTNGSLAYDAKIGKRYQLFTSKRDGSAPQQLTHFADSDSVWAAWSPSGNQIAFERDVYTGLFVTRAAIYTMNAGGGGLKQVTPWQNGGLADKIDWSPDGSRIAFSSPGIGDRPGISSNVFTVRPDGSGRVKLTNSRGGKINNGLDSWSPDGKKIAFVSNRTGTYEIYVMNANGSGITEETHGPEAHRASWGTHH